LSDGGFRTCSWYSWNVPETLALCHDLGHCPAPFGYNISSRIHPQGRGSCAYVEGAVNSRLGRTSTHQRQASQAWHPGSPGFCPPPQAENRSWFVIEHEAEPSNGFIHRSLLPRLVSTLTTRTLGTVSSINCTYCRLLAKPFVLLLKSASCAVFSEEGL